MKDENRFDRFVAHEGDMHEVKPEDVKNRAPTLYQIFGNDIDKEKGKGEHHDKGKERNLQKDS